MSERYSSGRDPRRNAERPVRSAARPQGSAPRTTRPQGNRPPQGRRPAPRRRRKRIRPQFFIFLIVLIALIVALVAILSGKRGDDPTQPMPTPVPNVASSGLGNATIASGQPNAENPAANDAQTSVGAYSPLADLEDDDDDDLAPLAEEDRVHVTDLSINTSLPDTWTNFLLLGTDERTLNESARTDTMIICSISKQGEVKLTSIMRDLAVKFDDLGKNNGTYRINSANFFGGPEYAMKTVNECFGLNIQYYATVNFFGFQRIVEALGGIDVDITEAEMNEINKKQHEQYKIALAIGEAAPTLERDLLTTYGANTHLNGHQTLAYARVRKSDGSDSDFTRAERQRTVLTKLMSKLRGKSLMDIGLLVNSLSQDVTTNMDFNTVAQIAFTVLNSGLSNVETNRVPVNGTYKEETRNEKDMLYDCDWETNRLNLYNFIYE